MKIYYLADVEERKYEGRSQTSLLLKEFLQSRGFEFVDHPAKADLIQIHSSGIADSFKAVKLKQKYNTPVIYTLYSISKTEPFNHFRNHLAQRYYLRKRKTSFWLSYSAVIPLKWRAYNLKKLDCVVTPSQFVQRRLFKNTKLIRIGIDTKQFRPLSESDPKTTVGSQEFLKPAVSKFTITVSRIKSANKNQNVSANQKPFKHQPHLGNLKVGYFGHPSVYKGVLDFARASKKFPVSCQSYVHLSDLSPKMIHSLKKINPKLNIVGYLKNLPPVYNSMDVVVLPYRSHLAGVANPLVLLEAMACGKAIITTNFSYLREIVRDSAIIVKPYSPQQIAQAVRTLENSTLRQQLGERARRIIEAEFTQQKMFEKYLQLYKGLV